MLIFARNRDLHRYKANGTLASVANFSRANFPRM